MTHELALKLAQTETPKQMADRIVELYETIDDLRTKFAVVRGRVDKVRHSLSVMFDRSQGLSLEDWKKWAHGYIEFMLVDLDEALAAIGEE